MYPRLLPVEFLIVVVLGRDNIEKRMYLYSVFEEEASCMTSFHVMLFMHCQYCQKLFLKKSSIYAALKVSERVQVSSSAEKSPVC